jgi:hypothetical protein
MLEGLVRERGGRPVRSVREAARVEADEGFVAVLLEDDGLIPAVAKLSDATPALYLLKEGLVGGPDGEPGCRRIEAAFVARVLDAALAGRVEWEEDPDFGYLIAAEVAGVEPPDDELLIPRLLYARNGRVYEHAALVPRTKEARADVLAEAAP